MKKITLLSIVTALVLSATCPIYAEEKVGMPNPVQEVTIQEQSEKAGLGLKVPENAENVKHFIIDMGKDQMPIGEVQFTLDGKEYCLRVQSTPIVSLDDKEAADISGLYYDDVKEMDDTIKIHDRKGFCVIYGDAGFVAWLDVVPGMIYNLSMTEGADKELLVDTANRVFELTMGDDINK